MRAGNPNLRANPYQPPAIQNSRVTRGVNPMGIGTESLQGNVPQPPKRNWVEGYGARPETGSPWAQQPQRRPLEVADDAGVMARALAAQGISYGGSQGVQQAGGYGNPSALAGYGWSKYAGYTLGGQPVSAEQYAQAYRQAYGERAYLTAVANGNLPGPSAADLLGYTTPGIGVSGIAKPPTNELGY